MINIVTVVSVVLLVVAVILTALSFNDIISFEKACEDRGGKVVKEFTEYVCTNKEVVRK